MYFKTEKSSKTGIRIQDLNKKREEAVNAATLLMREYGCENWKYSGFNIDGGVQVMLFNEQPDSKIYKKKRDGFYPKKTSKIGRELIAKIEELPVVSNGEINDIFFDHHPIGKAKCKSWTESFTDKATGKEVKMERNERYYELMHYRQFGFFIGVDNFFYITGKKEQIDKYGLPDDVIEIKRSEYEAAKEALEEAEQPEMSGNSK